MRLRRLTQASRPVSAARSRSTARMSKNSSEASAKRSVTATAARPCVADGEDLALLGGDVDLLDRLAAGARRRREQARPRPRPSARPSPLAASTAPSASRIARAAQVGRHLAQRGERRLGGLARRRLAAVDTRRPSSAKIPTVSLARASWITVVVVCAIARDPLRDQRLHRLHDHRRRRRPRGGGQPAARVAASSGR